MKGQLQEEFNTDFALMTDEEVVLLAGEGNALSQ